MRIFQFLRDGGVLYTLVLAAKGVYRTIRGLFPERYLKIRRASRAKSKNNCTWKPAPSRW